ncbi:MAG: VOC family protein [Solirubrobacteraceae bacterium]
MTTSSPRPSRCSGSSAGSWPAPGAPRRTAELLHRRAQHGAAAQPGLRAPRRWLRLGAQQLHLFLRETPAPEFHHLGLDVDDFETAYVMARERGLLDDDTFAPTVRELNDGSVQMYLRDPAGNLVEIDWPDG